MRFRTLAAAAGACLLAVAASPRQEREDRTLLHDRADARDHQRGVGRARDAPRARARAVPARPSGIGIQGPLPRERSHGAASRKEYGFANVAHRDVSHRPGLAAERRRAVDDDAERRAEALRHPRHRALARRRPTRTGTSAASWSTSAQGRPRRTSTGRTSRGSSSSRGAQRSRRHLRPRLADGRGRRPRLSARSAPARARRLPDQIVSTDASRSRRTAAWALSPRVARATRDGAATAAQQGHDPVDREGRSRCRTSRKSSTRRFPATAARRRKWPSAATSTRAISSRAPTTTTPAAR